MKKAFFKKEDVEKFVNDTKADEIFCLQKIPPKRTHKSSYAEIVINPEKGEKEKIFRLGPAILRFFWLTLNAKLSNNSGVSKTQLEEELNYRESYDKYWFSKRIATIKKWLKKRNLLQYFEFHNQQVITTLSPSQISVTISDYEDAKKETKISQKS